MKKRIMQQPYYGCKGLTKKFIILAALVLSPGICLSDDEGVMNDDFAFTGGKAWQEAKVNIPPTPVSKNLQELTVMKMPAYKFYVDLESVKVDAGDNVARYTIVIETRSGLRNIFYEGIRCDTDEYKLYAIGLWGKPLSPVKSSHWKPIGTDTPEIGVYRYDLATYFLCRQLRINGKKQDIVQLLQYPPNLADPEFE